MSKYGVKLYNNAAVVRLKDRRVELGINLNTDTVFIQFSSLTKGDNRPAATTEILKDRLRLTRIKISAETLEAIAYAYFEHKKHTKEVQQ